MPRSNGYVLYTGPSLLDGAPIVVIATMASTNQKTGSGPQTWILRADVSPVDAIHSGADASICGECSLRGRSVDGHNVGRSCYVRVFHGPRAVWDAWRRGRYRTLSRERIGSVFAGTFVRLGAYGDPAAAPRWLWEAVTRHASAWSGYTHQWSLGFALADLCMASVENDEQAAAARALGYRTFRVVAPDVPRMPDHFVCPASAERGHVLQCHACRGCGGTSRPRRGHVQIAVHGTGAKHALPELRKGGGT